MLRKLELTNVETPQSKHNKPIWIDLPVSLIYGHPHEQ